MRVNQFFVIMLKKYFGHSKEKQFVKRYHDLDSFFGRGSEKEYEKIIMDLEKQNRIDWELWR